MLHHDGRDYDVACAETKAWFEQKIAEQTAAGAQRAVETLMKVEQYQPKDVIRTGVELSKQIHVVPQDDAPSIVVLGKDAAIASRVHRHAQQQLCQRVGVPSKFVGDLCDSSEGWQAELAQHTLRELYEHNMDRMLLRAVAIGQRQDGANRYEVRGVLSDRYRRLDSRVLFAAFADAAKQVGLVPVDGVFSDIRASLRCLLPKVFQPIKDEVVAYGMELRNSDFGAGGVEVSCFEYKPWCTNLATLQNELRKVHLGSRLPADLQLTQRTYDLDAETFASAIRDVTTDALSDDRLFKLNAATAAAADKKLTWAEAKKLVAGKLTKAEQQKAEVIFDDATPEAAHGASGPGSRWKLSNVISWMANGESVDADRKLDLQRFAGELVHG